MRGFAQTAHCPRCGTEKATGGDVAPIVTCATCGLGFDPRPREPQPRALVRVEGSSLVTEQVSESDAVLVVRDSVWSGVLHVLIAVVTAWFAIANHAVLAWWYVPAFAALGAWSLYAGASKLVNRIYVQVTRDLLAGWERPLPRHRQRMIRGEVREVAVAPKPTRRTYDVIVDGQVLVNVPHEALANELVERIESHRRRLAGE